MKDEAKELARLQLRRYLFSYPQGKQRTAIRTKIVEACKVRVSTLNNWQHGTCAIPPLAMEKIEEVAGRKIFS